MMKFIISDRFKREVLSVCSSYNANKSINCHRLYAPVNVVQCFCKKVKYLIKLDMKYTRYFA